MSRIFTELYTSGATKKFGYRTFLSHHYFCDKKSSDIELFCCSSRSSSAENNLYCLQIRILNPLQNILLLGVQTYARVSAILGNIFKVNLPEYASGAPL